MERRRATGARTCRSAQSRCTGRRPGALRSPWRSARTQPSATGYRLLDDGSRYEFRSPVTLGGKSLGWVGVEYARDVIYEPVFRTQVKVTLIAALFVYAAVFL